jgi:hypothetical protein
MFRVTDFGVAEATSESRFKEDFFQLADVLAQLLRVVSYQACSPKEKSIFNALRHHFLACHLVETDLTRDPLAKQPRELFLRLRELETELERTDSEGAAKLVTPFDFLSCEQIGEVPALLRALYSDRFLGLAEIESRNNVVVTGPRGCGKTTVFRCLSLDQQMRVGEAAPERVKYLGVYYRCDDLYFAFPRYAVPERAEALDVPIHFVTATLLAGLLNTLGNWVQQYFAEEFQETEPHAAKALWEVLGLAPPPVPGNQTLKAILGQLQKQRMKAAEWHRFVNDPKRPIGRCFGAEVLQKACAALASHFSFLRDRPFYFYIDDYSAPKVTKALQASLNRLFMQRTPFCFFKLSTESPVSFAKSDIDEKIYVEGREFIIHNLGIVYLHADVIQKLTFVEDVFRRRLARTANGYPVKELEELLGSNLKENNNEDARRIREADQLQRWGKETLCRLCSGDIHYLISVVGDMVNAVGGPEALATASDGPKVPVAVQSRAIREAAGSFLKNLRGIPRYGEQLVAIVEAFGNVAHSYIKFRTSKNEKGRPPHQATRIEPYEPLTLSEDAQQPYGELLRYSVFIEDFRGKSRRGKVVPRLYLRRFLIPHFNLTFSTRDSIELEPAEFEQFLLHPKQFEDTHRLRETEKEPAEESQPADRRYMPENQLHLGFEGINS